MDGLLVIAHAPSPNTLAMREALVTGAQKEDSSVSILVQSPSDTCADDMLKARAYIMLTTENLGYMAGAMKDFFDRTYYDLVDVTSGRSYALAIRAGYDGTGTRRAVERIVGAGLGWSAVQHPLVCRGQWDDKWLDDCARLGQAMAAGLALGIY